jgi:mannose-6-phosphate isomerase-like protein (cupin superfamily)
MYWKESIADARVTEEVLNGGPGPIKRRGFFGGHSKRPGGFEFWELDAGVSEGAHTHGGDRPLEEVYYFQEGRGLMEIDGEEVPVASGDFVLVPAGVHHGVRNTGDTPLKLVIMAGRPV